MPWKERQSEANLPLVTFRQTFHAGAVNAPGQVTVSPVQRELAGPSCYSEPENGLRPVEHSWKAGFTARRGGLAPKYLHLSFRSSGLDDASRSEMRPETAKIFFPVSSTLSEPGELDGSCVPKSYSLPSASEKRKWGDSVSWQFLSLLAGVKAD